ncbi:MAG: MoaD/ThiS family protein [bacterium]
MKIEVRLFAGLRKYLPGGSSGKSTTLEVPPGTTLKDIIRQLKIPEDMPRIIMLNGNQAPLDKELKDGDVVSLFPPIAGG